MGGTLFKKEWMIGDLHPHVFAYYFKQWSDYAMTFHTHDSIEIMYVISGVCVIGFEGTAEAEGCDMTLKKGDFVILNANTPHRLTVDERGPCRMLNVEFDFRERQAAFPSMRQLAVEDEFVAELITEPSSYLFLRDPSEVYQVLKGLVLELDRKGKNLNMKAELLFAQLILAIARLRSETGSEGASSIDRYVKQAIEYMHHNYDRDIQVKDIAAAVSLHPGYLHRVFRAQLGKTLTGYLTELRMEKAMMLLRETDIAIADICDYVGVGSRQYFHAMFKKYTDSTPIAYRNSLNTQIWDYRGQKNANESDDF
ncbi:AraC-like DNA-binding protein/mannose-6-phosphate isomerase-like protein (cupin superfamily) [Paenibacillus endophyticus]|uniref:AraC-like DNA-binding protein/mannose-6-phosphate isomerase-like protein (Cupin superfamily) n=1 Tax=Paenibacillus endophyticus TaxID=1294268 RepID=A0A7W5G8U2_9BACL|nr:AraC family transcriptional regulator [Paenibacillus endophyticus]MBB3150267.1 AraC-like DNA-binding protein/mannose-6-phosphate isomerase-like protein (cupin superfamily) [Paenibacillus endophyticus]